MTDEYINADADNWVLARANCTLDGIFDELTRVLESDIREFNDLSPKKRDDRMFDSSPIRDAAFEVYRVSHSTIGERRRAGQDGILVQKASASIKVTRDRGDFLTITPRWNEETLACDLLVGGKLFSVWQISQKILGEFFFGNAMMVANMRRET